MSSWCDGRRHAIVSIAILSVTCVALSASSACRMMERAEKLDSVLLITLDTLRADHVSCYGPSPVETPHLDALGRRGARILKAWSPAPLTTPAHATILTGLYPSAHGIRTNGGVRLPDEASTLAEMLRSSGIRTAGFVASFTTSSLFGLDQGFDVFDDDLGNSPGGSRRLHRPGNEVVDRALAWLTANGGEPFFLWVHLFDPHTPYSPPPEYARRFPKDPYSGEIAFTDAQVGRLIEVLENTRAASRTAIVLLADHGEGLETHGEKEHGLLLYEDTLRIPFLVVAPGRIPPGTEIEELASAADVVPTVLGLLGLPAPSRVQGRDLLASSKPESARRRLYAETLYPHEDFGWSALYAIRERDFKYIESPSPELFDLAADPQERRNLHLSQNELSREMAAALGEEARRFFDRASLTQAATAAGPDKETVERLEALGYLGAGGNREVPGTDPLGGVGGRSPLEALTDYGRMNRAQELMKAEKHGEAIRLLEQVSLSDPNNPQALLKLAQAHDRAGEPDHAEARLHELVQRHPTFYLGYRYLSDLLERSGRPREARDLWLLLKGMGLHYVDIELRLAQVEIASGMADEAARRLVPHLQVHPQDAEGWEQLGRALSLLGKGDEALRAFRYSLDIRPTDRQSVEAAVALLESSGRRDEALRLVEKLLSRAPRDPFLRVMLETLRAKSAKSG